MNMPGEFVQRTISSMLEEHPQIGTILKKYRIDCVSCGSASCLFKNVIATHAYDPKVAAQIEVEIEDYFCSLVTK